MTMFLIRLIETESLRRWISLRLDVLGGLFTSGLAAYLVYVANVQASDIGFSLNMAGMCL